MYLTPHAPTYRSASADGASVPEAGAPEITSAMIDAGLDVLADYDPGWTNESELVSQIFSAMQRLLPQ